MSPNYDAMNYNVQILELILHSKIRDYYQYVQSANKISYGLLAMRVVLYDCILVFLLHCLVIG